MNNLTGSTAELLDMISVLRESGQILREGTRIEREKRWKSLNGGIEGALAACQSATLEGRKTADEYLERTVRALREARDSINKVSSSRTPTGSDQQDDLLTGQLEELLGETEQQLSAIEGILNRKSSQPSSYTITLFGRTGAGKSTLMEILTSGDGKSIGKGGQRTTRDVRSYEWKGLKITDVPGVASFDGEEDAETAHEAAKEADLILFLVTDDAPQAAEASHLARLRRTGHPIIGICNVKRNLQGEPGKRLFVRDSDRIFDRHRLEELRRQFDQIAEQYNPEQELPLVYTHLLARFSAERTQPEDLAEELKEESQFWEVEDAIAAEIAENGTYLRTRSYTDMSTGVALAASETLIQSASLMAQLHELMGSRVEELREWRKTFREKADQKLERLLSETTGKLRNRIVPFVDSNWKNKDISERWNREVASVRFEELLGAELKELDLEIRHHLGEIETDIGNEFQLLNGLNTAFSVEGMGSPNVRRWIRWTSTAVGAVTAIIGTALMFIPPMQPLGKAVGIVGGGLSTLGRFVGNRFKPEAERRREAASIFQNQVMPRINCIEEEITRAYWQHFDEEIDSKRAATFISNWTALMKSAEEASAISRRLGTDQQSSLAQLNKITAFQALVHVGYEEETRRIDTAARVPGQAMTLVTAAGQDLREEPLRRIESLLREKISTIRKGATPETVIRKAARAKTVKIDQKKGIVETTYDGTDPGVVVEVRLASQLTGLCIQNQVRGAR